jgi:hypothetical protein
MRVFRHLLVFLCSAVVSAALATTVRSSGSSIYVNEVEVVKLRTFSAGRSPSDRASLLAPLLESGLNQGNARVSSVGKVTRILVADKPWLQITAEEAKAANTSQTSLATNWCNAIQSAASLPPVKLSIRQIKAPAGGMRLVPIIGSLVQSAVAQSSNEKIVKVTRNGATLSIQGISAGTAQIKVSAGAVQANLDVTVQPLAAYFPQTLNADVTGTPASRDTVAGALVATVNGQLGAVDGVQVSFTPPPVVEIATGESRSYQIRVKASGPESFPSEGMVTVTVRNTSLGYRSEAELWYSNNPESVKKPMRLFVAGLKSNEPVRMLYHHMNVYTQPMIMTVEAINNTNTPAKVLIMPGDAVSEQNPVDAGFKAADQFVTAWRKYSGEIVEIPAYSIMPISLRRVKRNETVSGLCYLRLLDGGPEQLVVRCEARLPSLVESKWKLAMTSPTPWRIAGLKKIGDLASVPMPDTLHIYPHPFKDEDVIYTVGGPYGFVRIGQTPIARQDNKGALDGNFGVVYTIKANLENNTANPADVELVYESSAGYGGALFVIDGDFRKTPFMTPKQEKQLIRYRMQPYTTKSLKIMTVPLSGSAYPCTLTIRPVQAAEKNTGAIGAVDHRVRD